MIWKYHFNPKIFNFDFKIFNLEHGQNRTIQTPVGSFSAVRRN